MKQVDGSPYRILAVDDSTFILRLVENALKSADFDITTAVSGEEGLEHIKRRGLHHLAIVDINMPLGMDGFEFCERVLEFCDLPIIMLTAINEETTIISAIEQYAEDYVTKPFNGGELVARVRRVLRRVGDFAYTLDPLTVVDERMKIDFAGQRAVINGEDVSLTPTETKLLYILMRNAGRTVTTDFILRRLWPLEAAYEDRLRVYVHRLRRKIEDTHSEPTYILSERGTGYTFMGGKT
jgi:DNA-binding response OmpR family regulator